VDSCSDLFFRVLVIVELVVGEIHSPFIDILVKKRFPFGMMGRSVSAAWTIAHRRRDLSSRMMRSPFGVEEYPLGPSESGEAQKRADDWAGAT
jgi:hypothetical protein